MTKPYRSFADQIKDPRWQRKRLTILSRDNFRCQRCDSVEEQLHVHHKSYKKGCDYWDYEDDNFITLCSKCHKRVEDLKKKTALQIADDYCDIYETLTELVGSVEHVWAVELALMMVKRHKTRAEIGAFENSMIAYMQRMDASKQ